PDATPCRCPAPGTRSVMVGVQTISTDALPAFATPLAADDETEDQREQDRAGRRSAAGVVDVTAAATRQPPRPVVVVVARVTDAVTVDVLLIAVDRDTAV